MTYPLILLHHNTNDMINLTLDKKSLRQLERKIERLAALDSKDRKVILTEARKVAGIYVKAARSAIQDFPRDIEVIKSNGTRIRVPKGTLRRSMGVWTPKGATSHVAAGPRSGHFRRLPENSDGWFAHFVEYGNFPDAFGGKRTTRNTGVFSRTKKSTQAAMRSEMIKSMSKIIENAAKK